MAAHLQAPEGGNARFLHAGEPVVERDAHLTAAEHRQDEGQPGAVEAPEVPDAVKLLEGFGPGGLRLKHGLLDLAQKVNERPRGCALYLGRELRHLGPSAGAVQSQTGHGGSPNSIFRFLQDRNRARRALLTGPDLDERLNVFVPAHQSLGGAEVLPRP